MKNKELIALLQEHGPEEEVVVVILRIEERVQQLIDGVERAPFAQYTQMRPACIGREVTSVHARTAIYL